MPKLSRLTELERNRVKQDVSLETIYNAISTKVSNYGIPAKVIYDEIVVSTGGFFGKNKIADPCILLNPPDTKYFNFCISLKREYGITEIKLYSYGRSELLNWRISDNGNNSFMKDSHWIRKWEDEERYYEAIKRIYLEMFDGNEQEGYKFDV